MDRIAVLDMDSIAYAISSPSKVKNKNGEFILDELGKFVYQDKTEEDIITNSKSVLVNIFKSCLAENYIGFIKGSNTGKHRYAIKSDYKHNRSSERPKWWDFTAHHLITNYNIHIVDNYEVDDIVNIYRLMTPNSFMVACDKDLLNLPGVHFNWQKNEWKANTIEDAEKQFWIDMITGQSGDGIKGLPRKGEVFANKFFENQKVEDYPYLVFDLYKNTLKNGISEFAKNYECLKILDLHDSVDFNFDGLKPVKVIKESMYD